MVMKGRLGKPPERRAQQSRARVSVSALDEQDPLEALGPYVPRLKPVLDRKLGGQSHVAVCGRKITGHSAIGHAAKSRVYSSESKWPIVLA